MNKGKEGNKPAQAKAGWKGTEVYILRLYTAGSTVKGSLDLTNLGEIRKENLNGR
jgi:hypothetical protein